MQSFKEIEFDHYEQPKIQLKKGKSYIINKNSKCDIQSLIEYTIRTK